MSCRWRPLFTSKLTMNLGPIVSIRKQNVVSWFRQWHVCEALFWFLPAHGTCHRNVAAKLLSGWWRRFGRFTLLFDHAFRTFFLLMDHIRQWVRYRVTTLGAVNFFRRVLGFESCTTHRIDAFCVEWMLGAKVVFGKAFPFRVERYSTGETSKLFVLFAASEAAHNLDCYEVVELKF